MVTLLREGVAFPFFKLFPLYKYNTKKEIMKAYKIWHDEKNFIHKDTTNELNVKWTTNIKDAKTFSHRGKGLTFFFETLRFGYNGSLPDALHLFED